MKIVFSLLATLLACALARPAAAQATVYYSTRDVLTDFFRNSQSVTFQKLTLDGPARERLGRRLGYALPRPAYTFYVARSGARVDGYALIDEEKGEHMPITFAVKLSASGAVERQEILVYREPRGDE